MPPKLNSFRYRDYTNQANGFKYKLKRGNVWGPETDVPFGPGDIEATVPVGGSDEVTGILVNPNSANGMPYIKVEAQPNRCFAGDDAHNILASRDDEVIDTQFETAPE